MKRRSKVVPKLQTNAYDAYLFTMKTGEWEGFDKFLKKWSENHSKTVEWSSGTTKSITAGTPIFLMKQGKSPTGIIAAGVTVSDNRPYKHWSKRKQDYVPGRANKLRFTRFLDPKKDKVLDIRNDLQLPRRYWASMASGIGLPPEILHKIKIGWNALLGENVKEKSNVRKAPALSDEDADTDYEINNKDTRKRANKQIRERRGQRAFRQKMLNIYGNRCSISGCQVASVLEAAHIKRHLGEKDNHPQNGLLLRADLHTLFDLLLIGIDPETKCIHLHPNLHGSEYRRFQGKRLRRAKILPSYDALRQRWTDFKGN